MSSLNALYMLGHVINEAFLLRAGKWQNGCIGSDGQPVGRKALLVQFLVDRAPVQMLIHAPANYVGVYLQKGKGKWECRSYHDSCWRSDGVERFLFEVRDDLSFHFTALYRVMETMEIVEKITDAICVVTLTEEQIAELATIRNKKYK